MLPSGSVRVYSAVVYSRDVLLGGFSMYQYLSVRKQLQYGGSGPVTWASTLMAASVLFCTFNPILLTHQSRQRSANHCAVFISEQVLKESTNKLDLSPPFLFQIWYTSAPLSASWSPCWHKLNWIEAVQFMVAKPNASIVEDYSPMERNSQGETEVPEWVI